MASRRMVAQKIVDSAKFIKMPISTQALYFHLITRADDDGIVEAFSVMRMVGGSEDDLRVLEAKQFVRVLDEDYVTYITHWHEHNKIRADRKVDSMYQPLLLQVIPDAPILEAKERSDLKKPKVGLPVDGPEDNPSPDQGQPEDSLGKDSLGKDSLGKDNTSASSDAGDSLLVEFEKFWSSYDKKVDRKRCVSIYKRLTKSDREAIKEHLPKYIASTPDKNYRKNPQTYLNGRVWEDEDLPSNESSGNSGITDRGRVNKVPTGIFA